MKVYLEVVFISNFFIDLFIGSLTAAVLKKKKSSASLFIGAILGAICSSVYPVAGSFRYVLKALCLLFMPAIIILPKNIKEYLVALATFCFITFILGGIVLFLCDISRGRLGYKDFTYGALPVLLSVSCLGIIVLFNLIGKEFLKSRQKNELFYNVRLITENNSIKCRAFYDSGNRVYAKNGEPVIFLSERYYNIFANHSTTGAVEIMSLGGIKTVPIYGANLEIYFDDGTNKIYKVNVGKLSVPCEAEILLHSDMQGR